MTIAEKLEEAGVRTVYTCRGIIFSLTDPALKAFKGSEIHRFVKGILYRSETCDDTVLREHGLTGHWAVVKNETIT